MTWVKLDDNFADHPKVRRLSLEAFRLYVEALCYCGRYHTDGLLETDTVESFKYAEHAVELVDCGLWDDDEEGYRVHDFLVYNPSREKVEADRAAARERQSRRRSQGKSRRDIKGESHDPDPTRPDPKESGSESATTKPDEPARDLNLAKQGVRTSLSILKSLEAS